MIVCTWPKNWGAIAVVHALYKRRYVGRLDRLTRHFIVIFSTGV